MSNTEEPRPVLAWRIESATQYGIHNAGLAAVACRTAGLPFYVACALLEKESSGKNVWGNDKIIDPLTGEVETWATFSGCPRPVTREGYFLFRHEVIEKGKLSNGVGPTQITWKGFFIDMEEKGLQPWSIPDNMLYGFEIMTWLYAEEDSWLAAGARYNGSVAYGVDFLNKVRYWHKRLNIKGPMPT